MAGMTVEVFARQLVHKDTRITMRHYAHLCLTFKQESNPALCPVFWLWGRCRAFGRGIPCHECQRKQDEASGVDCRGD